MVWIHGGGYHFGTKSLQKSNAMALAALEEVIVVSINYRLGILGFLSTGESQPELRFLSWAPVGSFISSVLLSPYFTRKVM